MPPIVVLALLEEVVAPVLLEGTKVPAILAEEKVEAQLLLEECRWGMHRSEGQGDSAGGHGSGTVHVMLGSW